MGNPLLSHSIHITGVSLQVQTAGVQTGVHTQVLTRDQGGEDRRPRGQTTGVLQPQSAAETGTQNS